jgi:hypothetical protein
MPKTRKVKCAREGCKTKFRPRVSTQIYCTPKCANRVNQQRRRERLGDLAEFMATEEAV